MGISLKGYESKLKGAKIPKNEISIVVHNLGELQKAGYDANVLNEIVNNVTTNLEFKTAFLADYRSTAEKILFKFRKRPG
jgi:hypothetical protein